jgi:hypothetical protein
MHDANNNNIYIWIKINFRDLFIIYFQTAPIKFFNFSINYRDWNSLKHL